VTIDVDEVAMKPDEPHEKWELTMPNSPDKTTPPLAV
jgi:hypothetical protein